MVVLSLVNTVNKQDLDVLNSQTNHPQLLRGTVGVQPKSGRQ